jgi:hypothetical protein
MSNTDPLSPKASNTDPLPPKASNTDPLPPKASNTDPLPPKASNTDPLPPKVVSKWRNQWDLHFGPQLVPFKECKVENISLSSIEKL